MVWFSKRISQNRFYMKKNLILGVVLFHLCIFKFPAGLDKSCKSWARHRICISGRDSCRLDHCKSTVKLPCCMSSQ